MKGFLYCYRWGMEMKYNMGLYFSGLVFMKAISDAAAGRFAISLRRPPATFVPAAAKFAANPHLNKAKPP